MSFFHDGAGGAQEGNAAPAFVAAACALATGGGEAGIISEERRVMGSSPVQTGIAVCLQCYYPCWAANFRLTLTAVVAVPGIIPHSIRQNIFVLAVIRCEVIIYETCCPDRYTG